jgi:hypothetical protein
VCLLQSLATIAVGPAAAVDLRGLVSPYLQAQESRTLGEIDARAHAQPRRASSDPVPLAGVSVLLLPFAAEVAARIDQIKARLRDSLATYTRAHADLTAVREQYERQLRAVGAGQLVRRGVSDSSGVLHLDEVPVGDWLMLAWREEPHPVKSPRTAGGDAGRFRDVPVITGYAAVSYWRMRVSVRAGETTAVTLSDRGIWLTAIREELANPRALPDTGADSGQRR